jgi:hypothetical protein
MVQGQLVTTRCRSIAEITRKDADTRPYLVQKPFFWVTIQVLAGSIGTNEADNRPKIGHNIRRTDHDIEPFDARTG